MSTSIASESSPDRGSHEANGSSIPYLSAHPVSPASDEIDEEMERKLTSIVERPFREDLKRGTTYFAWRVLQSLFSPDELRYYKYRGLINLALNAITSVPRFPNESWNAFLWQVVGLRKRVEISQLLRLDYFLHVGWTIQISCSYRCRICPQKSYFKKNVETVLPFELADKYLSEITRFGYPLIGSYVGEPLMWPYFLDMVRKHKRLFFVSGTNGEFVPDHIEDIAKVRNLLLFVTIEGGPETMARMRRPGAYEIAIKAIHLLKKHRKPFGVIVPVSGGNFDEVMDMKFIKRQVYDRGAAFYCYSPYIGFDDRYSLDEQQEKAVGRQICEFQGTFRGARSVCLDYMRGFNSTNLGNFYDFKQHCMEIDPTGDVHLIANQQQFRLGNIGEETLVRMLARKRTLEWIKANVPRDHLGMNKLTLGHWLQ